MHPRAWIISLTVLIFFSSAAISDCSHPFALLWGYAGNGPGRFHEPFGVVVGQDGTVYVTDEANDRVQKFGPDGTYIGEWGTGYQTSPTGIAFDAGGNLLIVLHHVHHVAKYTTGGTLLNTFGTPGGPDQLAYPVGVALDPA